MKSGATVIATEDYQVPFDQDFTEETVDFVAATATAKLEFQQYSIGNSSWNYGVMLDDVVVEDLTAGVVVFQDDFDHENRIYVGPKCGASEAIDTSDPDSPDVDCVNRTCVYDGVYVTVYGDDCLGACGCLEEQIPAQEAMQRAAVPLRGFMLAQTRDDDLMLFADISRNEEFETSDDVPFSLLMPAFVTSELKTAFQIGFLILIPFLVIDLVIATLLMSMGMMMLSPMIISLPFKIMLFVLIDGWSLIMGTLAASFSV